jgi:hypothetical protein
MNEASLTTVWWAIDQSDSVARQEVSEPSATLCEGLFGPGATAYYVSGCPERPAWIRARNGQAAYTASHEVPVEAREACALWLPGWAGRHCAEEWHRESPGEVAEGTMFERWRLDHGGLPARGDVDYLRDCTWRLLGREPSETERRAFGDALLARLFELTPVGSDDGEVAA